MPKTTLAVTLDANLVGELDHLVSKRRFASRSQYDLWHAERRRNQLRVARLAPA